MEGGWREGADRSLAEALSWALVDLAGEPPDGHAVVALGGFGRGSLAIRSDVDVMIVHRRAANPDFVAAVLRPLWDAGLKVGHGVRTPRQARDLAASRLDAFCLLLTLRPLGGDGGVVDELQRLLAQLVGRERRRVLEALEAEERVRREAEPYRLMATSVKTGRGGLRTLDLLEWRRRMEAMEGTGEASASQEEQDARATLLSIRCALHALTGRPHETYDFDLREPAAAWLGSDVHTVGRRLLAARRTAERLADDALPALRRPSRRVLPSLRSDPVLGEARRAVRRGSDPGAASPPVRKPGTWGAEDRSVFLELTRPEAAAALWCLLHLGWVEEELPEWAALVDVPHVVPFHRHAVLDHTLATVSEMRRLLAGDTELPLVGEILPRADGELALWAALLHDVGKAEAGVGHAEAGVDAVRRAGLRIGLERARVELLTRVVEHHLLLAEVATKADVDDPGVVARAADRISRLDVLQHLYLLTVADSRAAGADIWSGWRAELVQRAYRRLERELARRALPEEGRVAVLTEQVLEAAGGRLARPAVVTHLAGFTEAYRSSHPPHLIAEHLLLAQRELGPGGMSLSSRVGEVSTRVVVTASDRPGLLMTLAGVMALHGLSIIDARFATRSDGRVFDTFDVVDGLSAAPVPAEEVERLEAALRRAMRGGVPLQLALDERRRAYRHREQAGVRPMVSITRGGGVASGLSDPPVGGGVVEVEGADRVGLLHDIGAVFARFAMPVSRARVDTRGGVAYDSFQVERLPADTGELESALLRVLHPYGG